LQAAYKKLTEQSGVPIPTYLKELREVQTIFSSTFKLMQTILDFGTPHFFVSVFFGGRGYINKYSTICKFKNVI